MPREQYVWVIGQHVVPHLGEVALVSLRPDQLQAFYVLKQEQGLSPSSVRLMHAVLHRALSRAVRWEMLDRNPAASLDLPRARRKEMKTLTAEQVQQLLAVARESRYGTLFQMAVTTGMREGELLGPRWTDLNWVSGHLRVQRQLQRIRGQGLRFSKPKIRSGWRLIVLGPTTLGSLGQHEARQGQPKAAAGWRWHDGGLMFPSLIGTPLEPRGLVRAFKATLAQAGPPDVRFYDLRHTSATLLLQGGVHPKVVQERLGHSQISMTLDTHSHVLPTMQEDAARMLDGLLSCTESQLTRCVEECGNRRPEVRASGGERETAAPVRRGPASQM